MTDVIKSHTWNDRAGIRPAVRVAVEISGEYPKHVVRNCNPCWVVDYEFRPFGRTRVDAPQSKWLERAAYTVHLYPPRTVYVEDATQEQGRRHSAWLDFVGGSQAGLSRLVLPDYGYARFLDPAGRVGTALQEATLAAHQHGEDGFWTAQRALCSVISLLMSASRVEAQTYEVRAESEPGREVALTERVQTYLKANLGEKVGLHDIARAARVSVSTLCHRYRPETGETPMDTLVRLRVELAKALLLRGYRLKQIADQLHFSDPFHLSKTFKRVVGRSPRDFLRRRSAKGE